MFVMVVWWQVYIAVYTILRGDAKRLVFGYDSFGNTCNKDNTLHPIRNVSYSGRDTTGMEWAPL